MLDDKGPLIEDNKGPLLFINSISSNVQGKNQEIFDTRNPPKQSDNFNDLRKLRNIIEMYQKERPVLCNIITNNIKVKAIPYKIEGNNVLVRTTDGKEEVIDISSIKNIEIIRF